MRIYIQTIDRKIKAIILNPSEEDLEQLGSNCDDRCNYKDISGNALGCTNPDFIRLLSKAIDQYYGSEEGENNWYIVNEE